MLPYIVLFSIMVICTFSIFNRKTSILTFFAFFSMAIFLGIRDNIGIDDAMYLRTFNEISKYGYSLREIETTYTLFSKLVLSVKGSIQCVYLLYSVATSMVFYLIVTRYINYKDRLIFCGIFLSFFFLPFLTLMRQFLAIILLTYAYFLSTENHRIKALVFYIMAISIHSTAIIGLPIYFLIPKIKKLSVQFKIISLLILYIIQYIPIVGLFSTFLLNLTNYIDSYYIKYYLSDISAFYSEPIGIVTTAYLLLYIIMLIKFKNKSEYNDSISSLAYMFFVLIMGLSQFGYLNRISYYCSIFTTIMLCRYVYMFKLNNRLLIKLLSIIAYLFLFILAISSFKSVSKNINPLIPYQYSLDFFNN